MGSNIGDILGSIHGVKEGAGRVCMCVRITDVCAIMIQVFMNIVLDEAFEEKQGGEKVAIGMIVCDHSHSRTFTFALETRRGRKLMTVCSSF